MSKRVSTTAWAGLPASQPALHLAAIDRRLPGHIVKPLQHARSVTLLVGMALLSAYFMADAYRRAKDDAIRQLYAQEQILAHQAAKGITEHFDFYQQELVFLGRNDSVVKPARQENNCYRKDSWPKPTVCCP